MRVGTPGVPLFFFAEASSAAADRMSPSSDKHTTGTSPEETPAEATASGGAVKVVRPAELLEEVLGPVAESMGYELVHAEFSGSGKHRRLAVYLDREGGISLDDCTKMSPILSSSLDAAEADPEAAAVARVLRAPYVLEVSSPGIDRPLAKLSHFRRHVGGLAKVTTFSALDAGSKQKNFNGRIESVHPAPHAPEDDRAGTVILLDPDKKGDEGRYAIDLEQIRRAHLVYEG